MKTNAATSFFKKDPRDYQLMVLTSMCLYGLIWLKFELNLLWLASILVTAFSVQYAATKFWKLPCFEWKSAAISAMSLCILSRYGAFWIGPALAAVAVLSKFIIRIRGKHVFNPTNIALAIGILANGIVWINPGQWGNGPILAFFIFAMGSFVVNRAVRSDVSIAFLVTFACVQFGYAALNGSDMSVPVGKLLTGSLLIFTFFMISDPKTTPDSTVGRIAFGIIVALFGTYLQLGPKIPGGLILSLCLFSLLVPVIDRLRPGTRYQWRRGEYVAEC